MKLAIFGASGRTGKPLVQQALEAGHEVVALVRTPTKVTLELPGLTLIQGDVLNASDVERTVQGVDAVLSVIGQSKNSPEDLQTLATRNIIAAMRKFGVQRIISLTGAGVAAPQDKPKLANHLIRFALKTISGHVLKDAEGHAKLLRQSDLDWVIVRGPMLNEGPLTHTYRVGWVGVNTGSRISRADLADFILKQASDATYLHQAPMVSA